MGVLLTRGCWCNYPSWVHMWACASQWACTWTCTEGFNAGCVSAYCPVERHVCTTLVITLRMGDLCVRSMCMQAWHHEPWCFRHVRGFYSPHFYKKNISQKVSLAWLWRSDESQVCTNNARFLFGRIWQFECKRSHKDTKTVHVWVFLNPALKEVAGVKG